MEICQSANKRGFLTPKRGKVGNCKLRRSSLQQIFTNPFYAGLIKSDDTYIKGKHKPMVSLSDSAKVQELLLANSRKNRGMINSKNFPFAFGSKLII